MKFVLWVLVNALALGAAVWLLDGITLEGGTDRDKVLRLLAVGLVFGIVTAVVRPVVQLVSLPLIVLTLGIMLVVINALMLMLTSKIAGAVDLGFHVDGFWTAVWGSVVISLALMVLESLLPERDR